MLSTRHKMDMLRSTTRFGYTLLLLIGLVLVGCEDTPSSVEDFDIQPSIEMPSSVSLALLDPASTAEFDINYQGLEVEPALEPSGNLTIERIDQTGSPRNGGSETWSIGYDGSVSGVAEEEITVTAPEAGVEETIVVTVSPFVISRDFSSRFMVVENFETNFPDNRDEDNPVAQRPVETVGGTEAEIQSDVASGNSTGPNALEINATAGDPVTLESQVSAPGADQVSFLIRPDPGQDFDLTLTFEERANGATVEREIELPVSEGSDWLQYRIGFAQIDEEFDPVAERAGGSGMLESVSLEASEDVVFHVDDFMFATEQGAVAEINDFEATTGAYVTFSAADFAFSDQVADNALGTRARSLGGASFFGYNQGGTRIQDAEDGELRFRIGQLDDDLEILIFVETIDEEGGFDFDAGQVVTIEAESGWQDISIPLSELGDDPSAIGSAGLQNVGFDVESGDNDFLIDDIRLDATGN